MDGAGARVIARKAHGLDLVELLDHPEGRLHDGDINSDRGGRVHDRAGTARHAMAPEESPHERKMADFVRRVCARLDAGRVGHEFDSLILVADSALLGLLRATLDKNTQRLIRLTVDKNLHAVPLRELDERIERSR